ncbi:MAG: HlyD family type I secretion periplasmic adaptor subunit [Pseudomonadota bacterium]|nr:HlyD family type I secretion periplasmic adaptor subunit [Pseudomonadota bacterium]MDP1904230.1 HlyD family type I secretion periplasmic adaptor subunit [Pseudomonadota bacterium]
MKLPKFFRLPEKNQPDAAVQAILADPDARAASDTLKPAHWGRRVLLGGVLLFLAWALFAPLSQGVPVHGFLKVEGNIKAVQHLKGGIVDAILVKEGDKVAAGQTVLKLNDVQSRAQLGIIEAQLVSALAVEARLLAEREKRGGVRYPEFLLNRQQADAREAMRVQNQLFLSRRAALASEENMSRESIAGLNEQIHGLIAQEKAKAEQLRLFHAEYDNLKPMYEQGFVPRNRMFELERAMAMLSGQRSADIASIGQARSQIAENRARMLLTGDNYRKEVDTLLTDIQKQVGDLKERHIAILDDLSRVEVKAPASGIVVGLAAHTVGGVIAPGDKIMDIVPSGENLVVEVQIPTLLIDNVRAGLEADVYFLALDQTFAPTLPGRLIYVSADRQSDPNRPEITYFVGRVAVASEALAKLGKHKLQAGMPVDVVIKTGERTFAGYLLKPLLARMQFAFTER